MGTMDSSTSMATPQSEIDLLMQQVADENQLDMKADLPSAVSAVLQDAVVTMILSLLW